VYQYISSVHRIVSYWVSQYRVFSEC